MAKEKTSYMTNFLLLLRTINNSRAAKCTLRVMLFVLVAGSAVISRAQGPTPDTVLGLSNYPTSTNNSSSYPGLDTVGPDGNIWATDLQTSIYQVTTSGVVTAFPTPTASSRPYSITTGPDGALWFTEKIGNIGRITTAGTITNEFLIPNSGAAPGRIVSGPDGNLWFTDNSNALIWKMTTAGVFTSYPVSNRTYGIVSGPDGNIWFTEFASSDGPSVQYIGYITTAGVVNEFPSLPQAGNPVSLQLLPDGMVVGPDGALWFVGIDSIGQITTAGAVNQFALPVPSNYQNLYYNDLAVGADGAFWLPPTYGGALLRVSTSGSSTSLGSSANILAGGITSGPDGALWYVESCTDAGQGCISLERAALAAPGPAGTITGQLPAATVATVYSPGDAGVQLASFFNGPFTSSNMPAGLSITQAGAISGTPTGPAGPTTFTVNETNPTTGLPLVSSFSINIALAPQTITWAPIGTQTVGTTLTLTATASSGLPVTYDASSTPTVCTVSGNVASFIAAGNCTITASQAGNGSYAAATPVPQTFATTVAFTITSPTTLPPADLCTPSATVACTTYSFTFTSNAGQPGVTATPPVTWSLGSETFPGGMSLDPNTGILSGIVNSIANYFGQFLISVMSSNQMQANQFFTLQVNSQPSITTASLPAGTVGAAYPSTTLTGTGGTAPYSWTVANNSLPTGFNLSSAGVLTGPAGGPTAAGTFPIAIVMTDSAGNAGAGATSVTITLNLQVNAGSQTITFNPIPTQTAGTTLTLTATASSGLPVSYTPSDTTICAVSGNVASFVAAGNCTITASQPGDNDYAPATPVPQTFAVTAVAQTITFGPIPTQTVGTPLTLNATASSGLPVSYTPSDTTICTVSGNVATFIAAGNCTITASQAGNATYAPAAPVAQTITVNAIPQTITFNPIPNQTSGTTLMLSASASSNLPVSFASSTAGICTVSGNVASFIAAGSCTITASQAGNGTYAPAAPASQTFTVLSPLNPTNPSSLPSGVSGTPYSATLTAQGGTPPYSWSISSGSLPAVLQLSAVGLISGTPNPAGTFIFTVQVTDSSTPAKTAPQQLSLNIASGAPSSITVTSGNTQTAQVKTAFGNPLVVTVKDTNGNLVPNTSVTFTAPATGASGTFAGGGATATVQTTASGVAASPAFSANATAGSYSVTASIGAAGSATFSLTNSAGAPGSITVTSGNNQSTAANSAFGSPLVVAVKDANGNPVANASVTFTAPSSGASAKFSGAATVQTDASGSATSPTLTANATAGNYNVNATVTGAAAPAVFSLTNTAGSASTITATSGSGQSTPVNSIFSNPLVATVKDASGNTVANVSVTFTAPASGASGTFTVAGAPAATATVQTNASGVATSPAFTANGTGGAYSVTASVSGAASPATFSLTNLSALTITQTSVPAGTVGLAYSFTFTAQNGTAPYKWAITTGALPAGLTLNAQTGAITGTATATGTFTFTLNLTDSSAPPQSASQPISLFINPPVTQPVTPVFTLKGLPATQAPGTNITGATVQLSQASSAAFTGTLTLGFTPHAAELPAGYNDAAFLDSSGKKLTTTTLAIPGATTSVALPIIDPGTVAGDILVTLTVPGQTPSTSTITVDAAAPIIEANSVQITNVTASGFDVEFVATSTTRDATNATFTFTPVAGDQITGTTTFTVDVSSLLTPWFSSADGLTYGGAFSLTIPFTLTGSSSAIQSVSVTLTNSVGTSTPVSGGQ